MYQHEKDRLSHITILICYTCFVIVLVAETILLGWDIGAVILLLLGVIASWILHITGKLSAEMRMGLYFILSMLTFFFYGIHETSIYDLAPVMIFVMLMYSVMEKIYITRGCLIVYYTTMAYDFVFVRQGAYEISTLSVTRLLLHLAVVGVAGYIVNLLIRRRSAEQKILEEKITELEDINYRTEQFLTNVSHELRTPINAVTGITSVMLKNETNPHKKKDIFAVQNAGRRLFQQIEDILDYTELDTGRIKISEENYMLSSVINDMIAEERLREKEHELEIVFDIDASVPSVLIGDGRKIKKIIKHLIDNAVKFTRKGGVYVRISAIHKSYGINLCIDIRDTGMGVSEEQLDKLKEKFYQTKNGRMRRAGGLGLGLSIVYGMATAMNGFVQIESKGGDGTKVFISIPQKIADETPCISMSNCEDLCVAYYLKPEKYEIPAVRDYYHSAIEHIVQGTDLFVHKAANREELERVISRYRMTHLYIGQEEYVEDESYFEELTEQMNVIVAAQSTFSLANDSKVKLVKKPVSSLALVNFMIANEEEEESYLERRMFCPGIKVLVVDDEPMNLMVAEGIFKVYRMEVTTAQSGMAAVELCRKEDYDLIFLDHMMPEMDGVETLKLLRKVAVNSGKELTVIAFTANAVSGAREMFRQEGFDDFVSKPVEEVELERVLKRVLPKTAIVYEDEAQLDGKEMSEKQTNEQRFISLERAGIHTRSGLNYCRGDEVLYFEVLTKFAKEAEKKSGDMKHFLEAEDLENYRIIVHALKSTAKMVGADSFSGMAKEAEDAAKNKDVEYIKAHQDALFTSYWEVVHSIKEVLGITKKAEPKEEYIEVTKNVFLQQLKDLQAGLETFEMDKAEPLVEQMEKERYNGTVVSELISEIKQDVENFECGEAFLKVETLFAKVEGGEI